MFMAIDDVTPDEWGGNPLKKKTVDKAFVISDEQVDESIDLIEVKHEAQKVIRELELALDDALRLRGIWISINDPLTFEGEKQKLRQRFMEIEVRIRAAIVTATEYRKKQ